MDNAVKFTAVRIGTVAHCLGDGFKIAPTIAWIDWRRRGAQRVQIFICNRPTTVREAVFLSTWTIQHVIDTNPGGVAGPIRIAVLENVNNQWQARELPVDEIAEHQQAIESAATALRTWRDECSRGRPPKMRPNRLPHLPAGPLRHRERLQPRGGSDRDRLPAAVQANKGGSRTREMSAS
jgi:hypothetical protein